MGRQRREHGGQGRCGRQHDGDVAAGGVARHQAARGGGEDRDRVDVDERLDRGRQRLRFDEDVAEEGEREDDHEAGVHHRAGGSHQQAHRGEDPGEAEGEDDDQCQRRHDATHPRLGPKPRIRPRTTITVPARR